MKYLSTAILFPTILLIILLSMPDFEGASTENRKHILFRKKDCMVCFHAFINFKELKSTKM